MGCNGIEILFGGTRCKTIFSMVANEIFILNKQTNKQTNQNQNLDKIIKIEKAVYDHEMSSKIEMSLI